MRRRIGFAVSLAAALIMLSGPRAHAESIEQRVVRQQAETRARIACTQARARGGSCDPSAASRTAMTAMTASSDGTGKRIEVSLGQQVLRAYDGNRLAMSVPVSTGGRGRETPTGRYRIQSKEKMHWSNQYDVWMPYAMRVVGGIFIHELPLTDDGRRIGTNSLGEPVSHGCIRVGVGDAESLFNWTPVGTPVLIG